VCNVLIDEVSVEGEFDEEEEEDDFETDEDLDDSDIIEEDDDVEVETIDTEEFEVAMASVVTMDIVIFSIGLH